MPDTSDKSQGTQPPPTGQHPLPRRTSPGNSVTLRHHRIARDASYKATAGSAQRPHKTLATSSPRRNSSGESYATGQSDPNKWFDQSNENPTATFDSHTMDVDPPFFQKESDSSNEEKPYPSHHQLHAPARLTAQSSSADEYRSVIDDLTVEIQKLKDELKRYKQNGPDMLRKDKLFEIKIHGLPKRKKRELEATLRDFTAGLDNSPDASSSRQNKTSRNARDRVDSASGSMSKHASSSSGSNNRPVDSAYASMSTGAHSSGASLGRPSMSSRAKSSEQKVESYLRDIPEGLYPRHVMMTDKEKKKLVVRRLEQLFTGKIGGRFKRSQQQPAMATGNLAPVMGEGQAQQQRPLIHQPPTLGGNNGNTSLTNLGSGAGNGTGSGAAFAPGPEPAREARIHQSDQQSGHGKKSRSRGNGSASNSAGDQTESGGNGNSSGGTNASPSNPPAPEQRPTRVKDLDPDRVQVPSDNMEYIKHLGLVPPELLQVPTQDVHPDADGWVYLNLLCNLAQLHMINVTPDFVRSAVTEISTKFQMSPDGRKIRWRGGTEGTRFSSDSSGDNAQNSPDHHDNESPNDMQRKRQKTGHSTRDEVQSGGSSNNASKFGPQISASSESFHYKPLFVHQGSSMEQTSVDETLSSFGPVEESNVDDSRGGGLSGSGNTSSRRKRRRDGAIIYYSGAPFCTDLSGDPGDVSPMTYMMSSGQDNQEESVRFPRPPAIRTPSGSSLSFRPLIEKSALPATTNKMDIDSSEDVPSLTADCGDDAGSTDMDLSWSDRQQYIQVHALEPCGLGGVMPEDHFMVVVTTKRPKEEIDPSVASGQKSRAEETTDGIINRLASMSTSSPVPTSAASRCQSSVVEIEYTSGRIKRLAPVRLPPPAIFFPPFSSDGSSDEDDESSSEDGEDEFESEEVASRRALHQSDGYPDGVDLSSGDEDGEDPDNEPDTRGMYAGDKAGRPGLLNRRRQSNASVEPAGRTDRSSAATAGGNPHSDDGTTDDAMSS